jgi:hypothetical protein
MKSINRHHHQPQSSNAKHHKLPKKLTDKQHLFLSEMNKILTTSHQKPNRISLQDSRPKSLLMPHGETPFDKSAYDSNPHTSADVAKKSSRRTQ